MKAALWLPATDKAGFSVRFDTSGSDDLSTLDFFRLYRSMEEKFNILEEPLDF